VHRVLKSGEEQYRCTYSDFSDLLLVDRLKSSNERTDRTYTYYTSYTSPSSKPLSTKDASLRAIYLDAGHIFLQGPSPGDVQNMLRKLPYLALYMSRYLIPILTFLL